MIQQKTQPSAISFPGLIWKIFPDDSENLLIVETRHSDTRKFQLSAIDADKKEVVWNEAENLKSSWWVGVSCVGDGLIVLHTFSDPQQPVKKGIYVLSSLTGKLLWENANVEFSSLDKEGVCCLLNGESVLLDKKNGSILKKNHPCQNIKGKTNINIINASHYPEGSDYYETVAGYLKERLRINPVAAIDYYENEANILISYYISLNNSLSNFILVLDQHENALVHDLLDDSLKGIASDSFFIYKNQLIYITEKNKINIYSL